MEDMKVKCINIYNEHTKQHQDISHWLTIGKEYVVLSVEIYDNEVLYLIADDSSNNYPGLHNANQFEVISHKIPSNWQINPGSLSILCLGPKSWEEDDFWDRCYDGDLEALNVYKREASVIMNDENNVESIFK